MRLELHLRLPAETRLLSRTRKTVAGYLSDIGATSECVDDVVLALDEACANAIRHGAVAGADAGYDLHASVTPERVDIEVTDGGPGLDPRRLAGGPAAADATSGRGLHLIRELMHDVTITRAGESGGTVVRMARDLD